MRKEIKLKKKKERMLAECYFMQGSNDCCNGTAPGNPTGPCGPNVPGPFGPHGPWK